MSDLAEQVHQVRLRIEGVQRARVRAEHDRDAALAAVQSAKSALEQEFQVFSMEEAQRLVSSLEGDVRLAIEDAVAALDKIGE